MKRRREGKRRGVEEETPESDFMKKVWTDRQNKDKDSGLGIPCVKTVTMKFCCLLLLFFFFLLYSVLSS